MLVDAMNNHCVENCPGKTYLYTCKGRKECDDFCGLYG